MIANEVFFGVLVSVLGIVFMVLYKYLASHVNLQFFWHKNPLMTPEISYGKKWGRIYVFCLGLFIFLIGAVILVFGILDIRILDIVI